MYIDTQKESLTLLSNLDQKMVARALKHIVYHWKGIETAPTDGTPVLVRSQNGAKHWMLPFIARFVENKSVDNPWITNFWSASNDDDGNPVVLYHRPLMWQPLTPEIEQVIAAMEESVKAVPEVRPILEFALC